MFKCQSPDLDLCLSDFRARVAIYSTIESAGNQLWTLWNMSLVYLFCEDLGLGIGTYPQDGKDKQRKTRKNIGWRYLQPQQSKNVVPMSSCVPQLLRHNALMCVTALELMGFSTEQICHQTVQEWRAYSRKWKSSLNWAPAVCQAFSHVDSHSFKFWIAQQEKWAFGSLEGHLICYPKWFMPAKGCGSCLPGSR